MQSTTNVGRPARLPSDHEAVTAAENNTPTRSGDTVTVASKVPYPVQMILFRMEEHLETTPMGDRTVQRAVRRNDVPLYVLNGCAMPRGARTEERDYLIIGGHALTPNIPRDFWLEWRKQQEGNEFIKNGLIFAQPTEDRARSQAKEHHDNLSGMEPIDPARPGIRVPGIQPGERT